MSSANGCSTPPAPRRPAGPDRIRLSVNVSPVQFKSQTLALKVAAALAGSGLAADRLELEITEAVLIRDDDAALDVLHQLRAIGVRLALDDFGTGYSSLSYLQRFPFDKIKIDRSFIGDIAKADGSWSIVQAVVNIATARKMTTTAEGVETQQQLDLLRSLGCTQMQGYLFSAARACGGNPGPVRGGRCDGYGRRLTGFTRVVAETPSSTRWLPAVFPAPKRGGCLRSSAIRRLRHASDSHRAASMETLEYRRRRRSPAWVT